MQMVGAFAEFERAMIRERTSAGLAAARAEGRIGGCRKKLDDVKRREIAEAVVSGRKTAAQMARMFGVSPPTVSRIAVLRCVAWRENLRLRRATNNEPPFCPLSAPEIVGRWMYGPRSMTAQLEMANRQGIGYLMQSFVHSVRQAAMPKPIPLSAPEAACLKALRSGAGRKAPIAVRAHLNLRQTIRALERLAALHLAIGNDRHEWHLTLRGKRADVTIVPTARKQGPKPSTARVPGAGAARLLALLNRPRRGTELMAMLGVTRQRVHQLIVALSAFGWPTRIVRLS